MTATGFAEAVKPTNLLSALQGNRVSVRLKWDLEYTGLLASYDSYFNLELEHAEELQPDGSSIPLGDMIIRCNNVLYIRDLRSTVPVPPLS
jgi:small nuclear ribonucleoprotein F